MSYSFNAILNITEKIVGAGSAGGVLSDKLTEDGRYTVLLLEAGIDDESELGKIAHVPVNFLRNLKSDIDWEYYTVPQNNACLAMKDKVLFSIENGVRCPEVCRGQVRLSDLFIAKTFQ